jgi:predicted O-methyltransferase YrrM
MILETGTARGFSSICMAKALNDQNCQGVISTIDSISHEKEIFWNCIDDHDGPKSRSELLKKWDMELKKIIFIQGWTDDVLSRLGIARINFAFLDAQHTKEDVLREFKFVSDRQIAGDIIVFDDVTRDYFPGVYKAVEFIEKNYSYTIEKINFTSNRGYAIATKN